MSRFQPRLMYENTGARSQYEELSRQNEDVSKLKQTLQKERTERFNDQKKYKLDLQKPEKPNMPLRNSFQDREKALVLKHNKEQALVQSSFAENMVCARNQSDARHGALLDHLATTVTAIKDQQEQGESNTVRLEERIDDLELEITDRVAEKTEEEAEKVRTQIKDEAAVAEKGAVQRCSSIKKTIKINKSDLESSIIAALTNQVSETAKSITQQAEAISFQTMAQMNTNLKRAETQADDRQKDVKKQLMWNSKSIETQNQAIKDLSAHLTRPKGCSLFCSYVDRYCNRCFDAITTRCHFQRKKQRTGTNKTLEESASEQNGVVILYGRSNLSKKIASRVRALFTQQNFAVPHPTAYHNNMPSCYNECQCPWLVVYAILQEDQSTKLLREAIKRIEEYLSDPNVQSCWKLVIVQCKWLPGGDLMTSLRALKNTTAIVVQMRDYHVQVVEKAFASKSSFGEVVNMLKMDAKVRPRSLFKDDKD